MGRKEKQFSDDRECRDILFLLLFIGFWVGCWIVAGISFDGGDPRRLIYPRDSQDNICGLTKRNDSLSGIDFSELPVLYFPNPTDIELQICIKECPKEGDVTNALIPLTCEVSELICKYGVKQDMTKIATDCFCPYATSEFLYRCFPNDLTGIESDNLTETFQQALASRPEITQAFSDVAESWEIIIGFGFLALGLCFVWLVLVALFASFFVWFTIFAVIIACWAFTGFMWQVYNDVESQATSTDEAESFVNEKNVVQGVAIAFTVCSAVLTVMIIALRKRIKLAIGIVREASSAVRAMPLIVFFPIIIFIGLGFFFAWWVAVALYLASYEGEGCIECHPWVDEDSLQAMYIYHLVAFYWNVNFLIAINQVTIAGAIGAWYWAVNKDEFQSSPVIRSFSRAIRYHLGSIAFGSLIIAIVQTIRTIITWMQAQAKKQKNKVVEMLLCCVNCLVRCLERFLKFISKNAYIIIAIYGDSFCSSAVTAFELVWNNLIRVAAVNVVSEFMIFLGKLFVALICGVASAQVFVNKPEIGFWMFPCVLVVVFSYMIASAFLAVYDMAIDTIMLCFLDEEERRKSDPNLPVHASEHLAKYIKRVEHAEAHGLEIEEDGKL
eukprot:TRINITY_DN1201_c0_g1_i1.p1 TRINITY_DN1201_c0_g1~~TRINITY_DN1201_c0_g1_i1.p1  ORF type:complete len:611 (-),score=135.12 TRINITY_DN1201_c0_g1_i1:698-2530(-)